MSYNISNIEYIKGKILKDLSEIDFKALYVFIFIISFDKLLVLIDQL
tara:strand:- start:504 stop:644 length:141 start_codon:yes stop_codon:yes gene_type:complete